MKKTYKKRKNAKKITKGANRMNPATHQRIIIIMPTHKISHYKTYKQFNSFIYFSKQAFLVP